MENDHYSLITYGEGHGIAAVAGGSGIMQQILYTAAMHAKNNIIVWRVNSIECYKGAVCMGIGCTTKKWSIICLFEEGTVQV